MVEITRNHLGLCPDGLTPSNPDEIPRPGMQTSIPDLTGTWWEHRYDGHRIRLVGRVGPERFVAHRTRPDGWTHTYRVSVFVLHSKYLQVSNE